MKTQWMWLFSNWRLFTPHFKTRFGTQFVLFSAGRVSSPKRNSRPLQGWGLAGSSLTEEPPTMPVISSSFKQEGPTWIISWMEKMRLKLSTCETSWDPPRERSLEYHLSFKTKQTNRRNSCVFDDQHVPCILSSLFLCTYIYFGCKSTLELEKYHLFFA